MSDDEMRSDLICRRCRVRREGRAKKATGEYLVTLPIRCADKDRCTAEVLGKMGQVPQPQRSIPNFRPWR